MIKRTDKGVMVGGIEYSLDWSAIILFLLVCNAFYGFVSTTLQNGYLAGPITILMGAALIISLLMHEAGHAYTALAFGIPMEGIKLFALGGMAIMRGRAKRPREEFWVGIAGPIVSLVLAVICCAPFYLGWKNSGTILLDRLGVYNLIIAIFNMVPAFPMDGGRVLRSILWGVFDNNLKATKICAIVAQVIVAAYLVFSVYVSGFSLDLIWPVILSIFIVFAGQGELQALKEEIGNG